MRRMCEESKDMGLKCMGLLENQGESIERWEEVADGINEDMKLAEKALKDMDRACFGNILIYFRERISKPELHKYQASSHDSGRSAADLRRTTQCGGNQNSPRTSVYRK